MKNVYLFMICLFFFSGNAQTKKYTYYLYLNDYNQAPTFTTQNGLLVYSGTNQAMKTIFDKYKIYEFKQAFPDFAGSSCILNTFLVVTDSSALINDLKKGLPSNFISSDDLTDKPVGTLNSYPTDYGTTHLPNSGANVSRSELDYLSAPVAWDITTGHPATIIGISDSAFDNTSPDLIGKLSFVPGWNGYSSSWEHGTAVAELAAGKGNNTGSVGVCMDCNILASPIGFGDTSVCDAFNNLRVLAAGGARVINMSWHNGAGYTNFMGGYRQAEQCIINYLVDTYDVVLVGAAGNAPSYSTAQSYISGETGGVLNGIPITPFGELFIYPASYDNVISVSTVHHKNAYTLPLSNVLDPVNNPSYCCTSSWFPIHVDLQDSVSGSASSLDPNNPVGVLRNGYYQNAYNPDGFQWNHTVNGLVDIMSTGHNVFDYSAYLNPSSGMPIYNDGTSFSAPIVSGTIGLMFDRNPCLNSVEVRSILQLVSKDIEHYSTLNNNYLDKVGSGKLEIGKSVIFVDEMMKTNGNAVIENHTFTKFDFNLSRINNKLTMNNVVFRDKNTSAFTAKNNIDITNADFFPNATGRIDLKINGGLTVCNTAPKMAGNNASHDSDSLKINRAVLYPNPNNGSFSIMLNRSEVKDLAVTVFDVFGKLIYQTKTNQNEFDLNIPNLPTGMYMVKLSSNSINETLKFIKE
ncbi:S8 family serine peptidase [Flavobacterium sp.]|uniref:S8 family serine peptidase n=1 Tax=Flavobacterium sp. TaxID=239 RepID=UPI0025D8B035|nr:S8 family serine peptidase [Flavobacterium sp.]